MTSMFSLHNTSRRATTSRTTTTRFWRANIVLCASAIFALAIGAMARADYQADFSGTGSAADFAPFMINATDDGDPLGTGDNTDFSVVGGNPYLQVHASPAGASGGGALQLRYQVAPSLFEGAEVPIPVGNTGAVPRTEARLSVALREILGGDDLPIENPFPEWGFTEFDPVTNTPDYASKVIVQIDPAFNAGVPGDPHVIHLGYTTNQPAGGTTSIAVFDYPGNAFNPGDVFELQVTENQARLTLNGDALTDGGGNSFFDLPANFFADNFDPGDALIPFFGVIRGASLEDEDIIGAGFDDIDAHTFELGGGVLGDADNNGVLEFADVVFIADRFLNTVPPTTEGDLNGNGIVDFGDFRIWKDAIGFGGGSLAEALAIANAPEPSTLSLLAMSCCLLLRRSRRSVCG